MTKPPAFQMYARDWLADSRVRRLRLDERGAYIDLLCVQWNEGAIPTDCDEAGMCIGIHPDTWPDWRSRIWPNVSEFFHNGRNARLDEYRKSLEKQRKAASKRGKSAAASRWKEKDLDATRNADASIKHNTATATATATAKNYASNEASEDEETWNDRLAPHCRKAGGEKHLANWLSWCKRQMGHGVSVERLEARIGGLCELRDRGVFDDWIPKGVPCTPAVFEHMPQLREQADAAWSRYGPSEAGSIIDRLGVRI